MSIIVKAKYKKGFFARKVNVNTFIESLLEVTKEYKLDPRILKSNEEDYSVHFVPTGIANFHITENGISMESVTSEAGPGYHAALVKVLDDVALRMGITFDYEDPTDYIYNRAMLDLQKQHVEDLKNTFTEIVERHKNNPGMGGELIGWQNDWQPTKQKEIVTLMGSYTVSELEEYVNGDFEEFAKNYLLWFNDGTDALYNRQIALFALWNVYEWRKPLSHDETSVAITISRNLEKARIRDNDIKLPLDGWKHVCSLNGFPYINTNEFADMDIPNLGYLRNNVIYPLPLGYGITIHPNFKKQDQTNVVTLSDGYHKVTIQVVAEKAPGNIHDPRQMLEKVDVQEEINGYLFVGMWNDTNASTGEYGFNGFIQGYDSFANVNFIFKDESERDWVLEVFKSFITPAAPGLTFELLDSANKEK